MANLIDTTVFGDLTVTRKINNINITPPESEAVLTVAGDIGITGNGVLDIGSGGALGSGAFNPVFSHPSSISTMTALTGANVISQLTFTNGHVSAVSTRALTPADIGASPSHTHPYLSDSTASTQAGYFGSINLKSSSTAYLKIQNTDSITAARTLSIKTNNADRTIDIKGNITTANSFTTAGNYALTLTTTAATNITLPTTGTLATLAGAETLTNKKLGSLTSKGFVVTTGTDGTLGVDTTAYTTNTGTVTSVGMTVPTGLTVSGGPITSSGTLALTLASGYSIPTASVYSQGVAVLNGSIIRKIKAGNNIYVQQSNDNDLDFGTYDQNGDQIPANDPTFYDGITISAKIIDAGSGLKVTRGYDIDTIILGTPTELTASTTNSVTLDSHTHSITTASAVALSNASTSTTGTSTSLARADHTHAISGFALASHGTHVSYYASNPAMDGTASTGTSGNVSRGDHVHPTDTSRASSTHDHGSITNAGKIGTAGYLLVYTGTDGTISSFATGASGQVLKLDANKRPAWSNEYSFTHPGSASTTASLTGANVISQLTFANGHVSAVSTRALTPADIGASPSNHDHHEMFYRELPADTEGFKVKYNKSRKALQFVFEG